MLKYLFCSAIVASHFLEINIHYAFMPLLRKRAFLIETFLKNDCLYLKFMVIFTILAFIVSIICYYVDSLKFSLKQQILG